MSLETNKVKYTGFIPPKFRAIPEKCDRATLCDIYNKNRKTVEYWRVRKFIKYSPHEPTYETKYNPKALYVSVTDLHKFKKGLHPDDYKRYAPSCDSHLHKGECVMDEGKLFIEVRVTDTQEMDDFEYKLYTQKE